MRSFPSAFLSTKPVRKKIPTPPDMEIEESEKKLEKLETLKTSSVPLSRRSPPPQNSITRLHSFSPSPKKSSVPLTPKPPCLDSFDYFSSGPSSDVMLPSPLYLEIEAPSGNAGDTLSGIPSDVMLPPPVEPLPRHLEREEPSGSASDILPYLDLDALITGRGDLSAQFLDNKMLGVKTDYLLQCLCGNYWFFEFLFSVNSERKKTNDKIFPLFKNFNLKNTQTHALYTNIIQFLYSKKEIYPLSFDAMWTLIDLLSDKLKVPEEIDGLLNGLTNTHTGHRILRVMNKSNVAKFLDFLQRTEKIKRFFSKIVDNSELAASIMNSSEIERGEAKQERTVFDSLKEITYFIHSLPESTLVEELLARSSEEEMMRFLNVLWSLNLAVTDASIFKKVEFVYRLKDMVKEEKLVQRIKRCFSFDVLTDSAETQRAFMRNEALIVENKKKLQAYSSVLISAKQARTIQTLWSVISINELKAEWVTYFRGIWDLLLEHWDPRKHLSEAITLRDLFKKIMLNKLAGCDSDAHDPKFYQLSMLPKEMTVEMLQNSDLTKKYQRYLDKMAICYEQIHRKQNKKTTDPFPKIKNYTSFKDLLRLLMPDLSEAQALVLGKEFTQLFVQALADHCVKRNWSEKVLDQSPQMLYIGTDLYLETFEILSKDSVVERSKKTFHLNEYCAKNAILKICEAINFIDDISLPAGSIENSAVNHSANTPDISPQKIERSNPNSPSSFFAQRKLERSEVSHRVSIPELNSKEGSKPSLHRSLPHIPLPPFLSNPFLSRNSPRDSEIPLTPGRSGGSNTIPASAELPSPRLRTSPDKK